MTTSGKLLESSFCSIFFIEIGRHLIEAGKLGLMFCAIILLSLWVNFVFPSTHEPQTLSNFFSAFMFE